jgi:uncharacterized protein (DUF2164 family)
MARGDENARTKTTALRKPAMAIELSREARQQAITSIERYFLQERGEKIGNIAAGALLGFFLEEVGPSIYNQGVAAAQTRLAERVAELDERVAELDFEVHEAEFGYWQKYEALQKAKPKR